MEGQKTELMVKVVGIEATALAIQVINQETLTRANHGLLITKDMLKEIGESFDNGIHQANDLHKTLITNKKKHTDPVNRGRAHLKFQISSYIAEQDRLAREKEEKARKEAEKEREKSAEHNMPPPVIKEYIPDIKPLMKGVHTRRKTKWRLLDMKLVPRKFKLTTLNIAAIDAEVKNQKMKTKILGIEVYEEISTVG